jgi:hypothetical protein
VRQLAGDKPLADLSPVTFVGPGDPPILTLQGKRDRLIPVQQAERLHEALRASTVPAELHVVPGLGHGWSSRAQFASTQVTARAFTDLYLRGGAWPLLLAEDFGKGAENRLSSGFELVGGDLWRLEGEPKTRLVLAGKSAGSPPVRAPSALAILRAPVVSEFVLDLDARSTTADYPHRDLCVVFGFQSATRFYYAHLAPQADAHAHGVFVVDEADRRNITQTRDAGMRWDDRWHRVRVRHEPASGRIEVFVDDLAQPKLVAVDKTFGAGRIGFGSFDDEGEFDALRLYGRTTDG